MSGAGIGVFGGTFDPIHVGHLRAAELVCEALDLERMLFVPSADPPLKRGTRRVAPAQLRLEWVRLAIQDNPRFALEGLELEREGPSYSVDTLRLLGRRLGAERLVFVIGQDAFRELPAWREPRILLTLASFAVMTRPPGTGVRLEDWIPEPLVGDLELSADGQMARHRSARTWVRRVAIRALDISATEIRQRLRQGRSVRYLVPEVVRRELLAREPYRGGGD